MTATLHEAPDVCAVAGANIVTAQIAITGAVDVSAIAGGIPLVALLSSSGADTWSIIGSAPFLTSATLAITDAGDGSIIAASATSPTSGLTRVLFAGSEATWVRSCRALCYVDVGQPTPIDPLCWVHPGGDYRDSAGVQNGSTHYVSSMPTVAGPVAFNVTALVKALLLDNTGFYLSKSGAGDVRWRAQNSVSPPALSVTTNIGNYTPPLLSNTWVDPSSGNSLADLAYSYHPFLIKFDLSSVRGVVSSATLTLYADAVGAPVTSYVDYLDMPLMITDPAAQLPAAVELGLASTVTIDSDLLGHAGVLDYSQFPDLATTNNQWRHSTSQQFSLGPTSYVLWSDYGIYAVRTEIGTTLNRGIASYKYAQPVLDNFPYQRAMGAGYDELYIRYMLYIDPDVRDGITQPGVKLTGFSSLYDELGMINYDGHLDNTTLSARTEHAGRSQVNANVYRLFTYWYAADWPVSVHSGAGLARMTNLYGMCLQAGRKYSIEQHIKMNTFTGSTPNADGILELWVDGVKVHREIGMTIRTDPIIQLQAAPMAQVYHGGAGPGSYPSQPIHYEMSGVVTATQYIGAAKKQWPTWRAAMGAVYSTSTISGTANMAGTMVNQTAAPTYTIGKSSSDIDAWNSLVSDGTKLWGMANGGHTDQWSNKVFNIDMSANAPQFVLDYAGSPFTQVPSLSQMDGPPSLFYYFDGLPCATHVYYSNQYIGKRNRLMRFYVASSYGSLSSASDVVDGYNIGTKLYDPQNSWQNSGIYSGAGAGFRFPTLAKHPTTEDVYMGNNGLFRKWTQTSATWSTIPFSAQIWQACGSTIDATRNRWVFCGGAALQFLDITGWAYSSLTVTGDAGFAADAAGGYSTLLHDTDNDRYLLFVSSSPAWCYVIHPTSGAITNKISIPVATNGINNRAVFMPALGGVVYLPSYASNFTFIPTRTSP